MVNTLSHQCRQWFIEKVYPVLLSYQSRKLNTFAVAFVLSGCILAYGFFALRFFLAAIMCVVVCGILLLFRDKRVWYKILLPAVCGVLTASILSMGLFDLYMGSVEKKVEAETTWTGEIVITEVVHTTVYSGQYIGKVKMSPCSCRVRISSENTEWLVGDVLTGEIQLKPWETLEDGFDERNYYLGKGVVAAAEDISLSKTGEIRFSPEILCKRWNEKLSARIQAHVQKDGLPIAMLLGNRTALEDTVKRDFRRLGIYHLLAVSGTHIAILITVAERLLIRLRVRPGKRMPVLAVLTILYMALTGFSASVARAGMMHLIAILCRTAQVKVRYFPSLNMACMVIILLDPYAVLDVGLHLSYGAVCGCLLTREITKRWQAYKNLFRKRTAVTVPKNKRKPVPVWRHKLSPAYLGKKALSGMLNSLVISCVTMGLSWLYFGEMSLLCLFTNLLYIPVAGYVLGLTILYLLVYPVSPLMLLLAKVLSCICYCLEWIAGAISNLPQITVSLRYPFVPIFLVLVTITVCILPFVRHKGRGVLLILMIFAAMLGSIGIYAYTIKDQTLSIYRRDDSKEGIVLRSGGQVLLVDVSDGSYSFTRQLLGELPGLYATELDGYMLTHYHKRHIHTLKKLSDNWILRHLYLPEPVTEAEWEVYESLVEEAAEKNIPITTFTSQTVFGLTEIWQAERVYLSRSTHPVTGFCLTAAEERLVYGSGSFSEGDPHLIQKMQVAECAIIGCHSPVTKKTFTISFCEMTKVLVYGENSAPYMELSGWTAARELYNADRMVYIFGDTN